jgi:dTDP-glucose 4,6-dehydratase
MVNRVVVTGGLGFMGANFVSFLHLNGLADSIVVFDNLSYASDESRLSQLPQGSYSLVVGDLRDEKSLVEVTRGAEYVFNFAAETHNDNSLSRPIDFLQTNVMGVANLLEASRLHGFHLHQVSTDEVYGDLPLDSSQRFTEFSKYRPSSPYSASKASGDLLVSSWVRSFGVKATITNSANNFGNFQHPEKLIPRSIGLILDGKRPELYGNGRNVRDWLNVDDHSSAVWAVASLAKNGSQYLVSSGQLMSNLELVSAINLSFGRQADDLEFISDRPGHDLMYASSSERIREEIGWRPVGKSVSEWLESLAR